MIHAPYSRPFQEDPFPLYHHFLQEQPDYEVSLRELTRTYRVHVGGFANVPIRVSS